MARREEDFSDFVCKTLNSIGYKWATIKRRQKVAKFNEHSINKSGLFSTTGYRIITAGSKREGSTTFFESDFDAMAVMEEIIATEDAEKFENKGNLTVLKLVTDGSSPGYACLTVQKHGGRVFYGVHGDVMARVGLRRFVGDCCRVSENGQTYVSSEIFFRKVEKTVIEGNERLTNSMSELPLFKNGSIQPRSGPSIPSLMIPVIGYAQMPAVSIDSVWSLPCYCPSVLESFLKRPRSHGWPTEDVLRELSQLEGHVVPVGHKRSYNHCLEWRICFTEAEIRLIEGLTEPQFYVFVLLKMFAKDVLKNVWNAMTTYMMKNVILWVIELTPAYGFNTDLVVDRFLGCLFFLKMCVKVGKLPSYMISDRNLLSHDEFVVKRPELLCVLDDCLKEKGSCLMRSSALLKAMTKMYKMPDSHIRRDLESASECLERMVIDASLQLPMHLLFPKELVYTIMRQDCLLPMILRRLKWFWFNRRRT